MPTPAASQDLKKDDVALMGLCMDARSSFMRGAAAGPPAIRAALHSPSANLCTEAGRDLAQTNRFRDLGDRVIGDDDTDYLGISTHVEVVTQRGARPLILGGDHAITYPVLRAIAATHGPVNVLHFDAHPDLYDVFDGDRYSHACPFARIMEEGLAQRLVQVGIRTMHPRQQVQADRFGVEVHALRNLDSTTYVPTFDGPVYVSFDLDVLDPAFAPGVAHHEPGGLTTREALRILHRLDAPVIGADVVEYNPSRDLLGMTAMVAAKITKELAGLLLR